MKKGDRVRHQAGWLATVTQCWPALERIVVEADENQAALNGEYSIHVFEPTDE